MKFSTVLLSLASVASIAYADPVDENGDGLPDGDIPGCAVREPALEMFSLRETINTDTKRY